jgi:hypothetical protein
MSPSPCSVRHQLNVLRRKAPKRLAFSGVDRLVFETPPVRAEFLEVCNPGFGSPLGALKYAGMPAQAAPRRALIAVAAASDRSEIRCREPQPLPCRGAARSWHEENPPPRGALANDFLGVGGRVLGLPYRGPPAAKLQVRRAASKIALAKAAEKLRSRQMATQARASAAMAAIWQEAVFGEDRASLWL